MNKLLVLLWGLAFLANAVTAVYYSNTDKNLAEKSVILAALCLILCQIYDIKDKLDTK